MSNVLSDDKRNQIEALGRLGWSLRRIEQATGVRRETASAYLKAAGIAIRAPGGWGRAKPANESITDPKGGPDPKPANESITDFGRVPARASAGRTSACVAFDSVIVEGLSRGRNAMGIYQDLVSDHGFAGSYGSVMRYVQKLR